MPRLSLYRPEKGNDYKFIDRQASEMFTVGGTDLYLHKYLGANTDQANATADQPHYDSLKETNIQDLLFLENRDRKYDSSIYRLRGVYNVQDLDFNLSQFGLFLDNDTIYMTVHINDFVSTVGRKRFSPTWYPHLYRLKLTKIVDSQQYKEIFDQKIVNPVTGEETNNTLRDILSTHSKELAINDALIAQAEADAPKSGYETQHFYTLALDENGRAAIQTVDDSVSPPDASSMGLDVSRIAQLPKRNGYTGYLVGDGIAPNGVEFGHGITFPNAPIDGDFFLRTDFLPNRLYRFDGTRWIKFEDNVRTTLTNTDTRNTLKGGFINNSNKTGVNLITTDFVTPTANITTYLTNETFAAGMYATAVIGSSQFPTVTVTAGAGGKALLTFSETAPTGKQVEWKLYQGATEERRALSKTLKPKADL